LIISANPPDAVSFSDGTTINHTRIGRPVAIEGTAPREMNLEWFYTLLHRYTHIPNELKSEITLRDFHTHPARFQQAVWIGMKQVLIHITDTLPHERSAQSIVNKSVGRRMDLERLHKRAAAGDVASKSFVNFITRFVFDYIAKGIQRNSSASRFIDFMAASDGFGGYGFSKQLKGSVDSWRPGIDFSAVINEKNPKQTIRDLVKSTTKGDAIFATATDDVLTNHIGPGFMMKEYAFRSIRQSRAFDDGNKSSIDWLESARKTSVQAMFPYQGRDQFLGKLHRVDSKASYFTQIGDIAAGFAGQLYERHGLVEVVRRFEFVTFNGERISEDKAIEIMQNWKQLGSV
jgi:hypothetical protein